VEETTNVTKVPVTWWAAAALELGGGGLDSCFAMLQEIFSLSLLLGV
jgi:hypothetical protein